MPSLLLLVDIFANDRQQTFIIVQCLVRSHYQLDGGGLSRGQCLEATPVQVGGVQHSDGSEERAVQTREGGSTRRGA